MAVLPCMEWSLIKKKIKNVGKRCMVKNYYSISLLSVVSDGFEKLVNNRFVDHLDKCGLFLIFSMILGLFDHLQIFWQMFMIELQGFLIGLGILKLKHLTYIVRFQQGLACWSFFTKVSLMEPQVRYLVLFHLFSAIDGFEWFWMGYLYNNIQ